MPTERRLTHLGHGWLACLLLARLLLGLAYSAATPLGEAPDEADHLAYAAYIAQTQRLPQGAEMTQAKHPPLYHALAAAVAGWAGLDTGFLRANPDIGFTADAAPNFFIHTTGEGWPWRDGPLAMRLARLISVLAGIGVVAATYALGRSVWPARPNLAIAAAAFVAFLPESLFIGGAMSNDMLAALLGTAALWLALRSRRPWHAAVTGGVMGLGLWAKVSVAALWPVVCLVMLVQGWLGSEGPAAGGWRRVFQPRVWHLAAIAGLVALTVTAPWFLRNRQLYGDWMGWPLVLATIDRRTGPFGLAELAWLARGLFLSFWGKFGGAGHIALPAPFYVLWGALVGMSAWGWARQIANCKLQIANRRFADLPICHLQSIIILLGTPLMTFAWLVSYSSVALGTDQGRLLFPAIGPLALLLIGGLAQWLPRTWREHGTRWLAGWTGFMGVIAVLALVAGLWLPYAPPAAPDAAEVAAASPAGQGFGEQIELAGYRWGLASPSSKHRDLILYWRGVKPIEADLRISLRLLNDRAEVIWEWKRSPGVGRFSTDHWPADRLVADVYAVPADILSRTVSAEIGVRPFPEGPWLQLDDGASSLTLPKPAQ